MALTGIALVLFVTFHVLMNAVALIWPTAYNQVCEFLGANWYALIASMGLAVLFIIHIIYAVWLTLQNRAARGNDAYCVTARQPQVEWSSKNMLVLGVVVLAFLVVHLIQFWARMQLQELQHAGLEGLPALDGTPCAPAMGTLFIQMAFQEWWTPVIYIIGFVALWFHMTHGFWSMFHTIGWDNNIWLNRLKTIGNWWTSIVIVLFIAQAVVFTVNARNNYYIENEALQEQYAEYWNDQAAEVLTAFQNDQEAYFSAQTGIDQQAAMFAYVTNNLPPFVQKAQLILDSFNKQCFNVAKPEAISTLVNFVQQMSQMQQYVAMQQAQAAPAVNPADAAPAAEVADPAAPAPAAEETPVNN